MSLTKRFPVLSTLLVLAISRLALANVVLIHGNNLVETDFGSDHTNGQLDLTNSIHLALDAALPGDTVEIRDADPYVLTNNHGYRMNTPGITLRGAAGVAARIRFQAMGTNAFFFVNAADLTFENLILDNSPYPYGNYAFQYSDGTWPGDYYLPDGITYKAQRLTVRNCVFTGIRGPIDAGGGRIDDLTFVDNTVEATRYNLGKSGFNLGAGVHTLSGNTFTDCGNGLPGAPDYPGGVPNVQPPSPPIEVWENHGALVVEHNSFHAQDGRYSVLIHCEGNTGTLQFAGNSYSHLLGGTGAENDLDPLAGSGYGIGACTPAVAGADDRPAAFRLDNAWPNPFNPSTTLGFTLAETGFARLSVHDLAGRTVATLVDGLTAAGHHEVVFQAAGLPSGVYFCTLTAGLRSETQKVILLK